MQIEITPRIVTVEQLRAVSSLNPIYEAACQMMLRKGVWRLDTSNDKGVTE